MIDINAQYKRDMDQNYLLLPLEETADTDAYPFRMLLANTIPGLLKCRITRVDGTRSACYEITSKQSVSALLEHRLAGYEDLSALFESLIRILEAMTEYLINPSMLLLHPDFLYFDMQRREVFFCLLPGTMTDIREQFRFLTEYLLPRLDHQDPKAVMLGYGIYRHALDDTFRLESIKETLYRQSGGCAKAAPEAESMNSPFVPPTDPEKRINVSEFSPAAGHLEESFPTETSESCWDTELPGKQEQNERKTDKKRKDKQQPFLILVLSLVISAILFLAFTAARQFGLLPQISSETILFLALLAFCISFAAGRLFSEKKKKPEQQQEKGKEIPAWDPPVSSDLPPVAYSANEKKAPPKAEPEQTVGSARLKVIDETVPEGLGETITLNSALLNGPASLVSREPGELAPIFLTEEILILGKMQNAADIIIPVPTVSRIHARIRHKEDGYYLSDLNSRNGTSVNGKLLEANEEYLLQDQDEVDFAQARYLFLNPAAALQS